MNESADSSPSITSPARALFEEIKREGVAWMDRAKEDKIEETTFLEFKKATIDPDTHRPSGTGRLTPDDKNNLSTVISGFANSDGGVCVWGVGCKTVGGLDHVQSLDPIPGLHRLRTELDSATHSAVSGGVGVEHYLIPTAEDPEKGFIATYVPRNDGAPIMALGKEMHCYWFRTGSSFNRMESWMVADRFAQRPQPRVVFFCRCQQGFPIHQASNNKQAHFVLTVGLENVGRGIAVHPALSIKMEHPLYLAEGQLDGNGNSGLPSVITSSTSRHQSNYAGGADAVIFPGTMREVTSIFVAPENAFELRYDTLLTIDFAAYCEGSEAKGTLVLTRQQLFRAAYENNPPGGIIRAEVERSQ